MRVVACTLGLALVSGLAHAAPPPPPPAYIDEAAALLTAGPTAMTIGAYDALLAYDLKVSVDGRPAMDKAAWMTLQRAQLGRADRRVLAYSEGLDDVMVMDQVDDRSDVPEGPNGVYDPRFRARTLRYVFGEDHRVHALQVVEGGGFWVAANRPTPAP